MIGQRPGRSSGATVAREGGGGERGRPVLPPLPAAFPHVFNFNLDGQIGGNELKFDFHHHLLLLLLLLLLLPPKYRVWKILIRMEPKLDGSGWGKRPRGEMAISYDVRPPRSHVAAVPVVVLRPAWTANSFQFQLIPPSPFSLSLSVSLSLSLCLGCWNYCG